MILTKLSDHSSRHKIVANVVDVTNYEQVEYLLTLAGADLGGWGAASKRVKS
jgi:hypothetical protein